MENYDMSLYDKEIKLKYNFDPILRRSKNKIVYYHNLNTGVVSHHINKVIRKDVFSDSCYYLNSKWNEDSYVAYWEASSDKKVLCLIICSIDINDINDGDIRKFYEVERYYFTKDKKILVPLKYNFGELSECGNYKVAESCKIEETLVKNIKGNNIGIIPNEDSENYIHYIHNNEIFFKKEFAKVFNPIFFTPHEWEYDVVKNLSDFRYFLDLRENKGNDPWMNGNLDNFKEYILPDIDEEFCISKIMSQVSNHKIFLYFNKLDKDLFVIRKYLCVFENFTTLEKEPNERYIREIARIYISGKDIYYGWFNNFGELISVSYEDYDRNWRFPLININKDDLIDSSLMFIGDIIEELPDELKYLFILSYLKEPFMEKIYRSDLKAIIFKVLYSSYNNCVRDFVDLVDCDNLEEDFHKRVGLNSYQTRRLKENWNEKYLKNGLCGENTSLYSLQYRTNIFFEIYWIKEIVGSNNISFIDNKSFDIILNYVDEMLLAVDTTNDALVLVRELYGFKTMIDLVDPLVEVSKTISKENGLSSVYYNDTPQIYRDYLDMVKKLNIKNIYKPYFKTKEDIKKMHDEVLVIFNARKEEYQKEAFMKAKERVKNYIYGNDSFCVIIPNTPEDIACEGMELSHCVKSYISRVLKGKTNIMFLRKVDCKDKPFFTVEISNNGVIEQIHGRANRNIDTEPGLEEFVLEWSDALGLKINNLNKIR